MNVKNNYIDKNSKFCNSSAFIITFHLEIIQIFSRVVQFKFQIINKIWWFNVIFFFNKFWWNKFLRRKFIIFRFETQTFCTRCFTTATKTLETKCFASLKLQIMNILNMVSQLLFIIFKFVFKILLGLGIIKIKIFFHYNFFLDVLFLKHFFSLYNTYFLIFSRGLSY